MTRLKNWASRFDALVESVRAAPFVWGSHDCCMWAAASVVALTGCDPAASLRGTYSSELGAARALARVGGLAGAGALCGVCIDSKRAIVGDVARVTWPDGVESLGVCSGAAWLCVGDFGLVMFPLTAALSAWGVGRE